MLAHVEGADHVDLEDFFHNLRGDHSLAVDGSSSSDHTRAVHNHVHPLVVLLHELEQLLHILLVGHIGLEELAFESSGNFLPQVFVEVGDDYLRPLGPQQFDGSEPEPRSPSSDDGDQRFINFHQIKSIITLSYSKPMDLVVGNSYKLTKKLNSGSFGEIYIAINLHNHREVAVKLEPLKCKHPQLQYEAKLLAYLLSNSTSKVTGFPNLYYFGKDHNYSIMVLDLLGPSLEELFVRCGKKFTLKTTVMIGLQIIDRLEHMHRHKFIHRDIKPENFLLGTYQNCDKIFVIDFGLSKKYVQKDGSHLPYKDNKSLTGTPRYASINNHLGIQQSRRDDIESVLYMLIYFLKGCLPWQNLKQDPSYGKYEKILEKKLSVSVNNLVSGIPRQFGEMLEYARSLHFIQEPNYNLFRKLLEQSLLNEGIELGNDDQFCWEELETEPEPTQKMVEIAQPKQEQQLMKEAEDFFDFDQEHFHENKPDEGGANDNDFEFQQF